MAAGKKNELLDIVDGDLLLNYEMQRATGLASPAPLSEMTHDHVAHISLVLQTKRADLHTPHSDYDHEVHASGQRNREQRLAYADKIHQRHLIGYMMKHESENFDAALNALFASEERKRAKYGHY